MKNRLPLLDRDEKVLLEHSKGVKNGDELIAHLPCHICHIETGLLFYLDTFKGVTVGGNYWYAGKVGEFLPFSRIELGPSDTFLLLDSDPATFLPTTNLSLS